MHTQRIAFARARSLRGDIARCYRTGRKELPRESYKSPRYDEDWRGLPDPDCRVEAIAEEYADLIIEWREGGYEPLTAVEVRTRESGPNHRRTWVVEGSPRTEGFSRNPSDPGLPS